MNYDKISLTIESICNLGCTEVNTIIDALKQCNEVEHTKHLTDDERDVVLKELQSIMEVYAKKS